jgi:hypothetical protein
MSSPSRLVDRPVTSGTCLRCRGVAGTVPLELSAGNRRAFGRFVVAALLAVSIAGCSDGRTISVAEAQRSAADQIRAAAAAVFPLGFTLEPLPPESLNCTTWTGGSTGQVMYGVIFWVNDIDSTKNNTYFDLLKAWWISHRWTLQDDSRPADPFMNATHSDGYLISLRANIDSRMAIGNTTPCVSPNDPSDTRDFERSARDQPPSRERPGQAALGRRLHEQARKDDTMPQPGDRIAEFTVDYLEKEVLNVQLTPEKLYDIAALLAERDADRAYDQTFHAGKVAVGLVTALGLVGGGVALFIALIRNPHVLGWVLGGLFLLLFAATFVSGVLTICSSMPPRRKITEGNTGWVATLAVEPDHLAQHYLDRASRRLAVMAAEAQFLASIAHAKHRRNVLTAGLMISDVLTGLVAFAAIRLGW